MKLVPYFVLLASLLTLTSPMPATPVPVLALFLLYMKALPVEALEGLLLPLDERGDLALSSKLAITYSYYPVMVCS